MCSSFFNRFNACRSTALQQGFLLESLGLVLLILSILALLDMNRKFEEQLDAQAVARGKAMATVRNAANDYLVSYSTQLLAQVDLNQPVEIVIGTVTHTVAHAGFPSIDDLVRLGKAPPNLSPVAPNGARYVIRITRTPFDCADADCDLEGLVSLDRPYLQNGGVDYARLGIAMTTIGDDGAYSKQNSPTELSGYGGAWSTDNPFIPGVGQVAGILAARFGYKTSGFSVFYKRDGSTPLTGDMDAAAHALGGVSTLTATGKITAKNMATAFYHFGQPCDPGDENAIGSGATGAVMVCRSGRWTYAGSSPVEEGSQCDMDGTAGTSTGNGVALICKNNRYMRLNSLVARNVQLNRYLVADDSVVPVSACDVGGTPDTTLIVNHVELNVAITPPIQAVDALVSPAGANWLVSLKVIDALGGRHSGNDYNLSAVLNTECRY